jgi:hypothetical protein
LGVELKKALPWFAGAAVIVLADRLTKLWMLEAFAPGERLAVTDFFNLVLVFNKGAAFSFLAGASGWQTPVFAAISSIAAIVITVLILRNSGNRMLCAALGLILGGAKRRARQPLGSSPLGARCRLPRFPCRRLALAGIQRRRLRDLGGRGAPDPRELRAARGWGIIHPWMCC